MECGYILSLSWGLSVGSKNDWLNKIAWFDFKREVGFCVNYGGAHARREAQRVGGAP